MTNGSSRQRRPNRADRAIRTSHRNDLSDLCANGEAPTAPLDALRASLKRPPRTLGVLAQNAQM